MSILRQWLKEKQEQLDSMNCTVLTQGVKKETEKAILVELFDVKEMERCDFWMPKSVIESQNGNEFTLSSWFFQKNSGMMLNTQIWK